MKYSDVFLEEILRRTTTIACVGMSMNTLRPSHYVGRYLTMKGYRILPVNPGQVGKRLFGEDMRGSLVDIPADIDVQMVDIFRRSEDVLPIVVDALKRFPKLQTVWMQIGVENEEAATLAQAAGCDVVQNRCPKIEYQRLFGELRMAGFNTGVISSKI